MSSDKVLVSINEAAAVGVVEARVHYRADRYLDAINAAEKTLGRITDPNSNFTLLMRGELGEKISFTHVDSERVKRSIIVPSRGLAIEALCWSMRAHVALIEARDENANWSARLGEIGKRISVAGLEDHDVRILLAQAFMFSGEYAESLSVGHALMHAAPLDVAAGWVTFQATRRSGDLEAAAELAHRLIERYVVQEGSTHYRWAVKLAYCIDDWSEVIRLSPEGLRRLPDDFEMLTMFTSALLMSRRKEEARPYYERMRALAPDAPFVAQVASAFAIA